MRYERGLASENAPGGLSVAVERAMQNRQGRSMLASYMYPLAEKVGTDTLSQVLESLPIYAQYLVLAQLGGQTLQQVSNATGTSAPTLSKHSSYIVAGFTELLKGNQNKLRHLEQTLSYQEIDFQILEDLIFALTHQFPELIANHLQQCGYITHLGLYKLSRTLGITFDAAKDSLYQTIHQYNLNQEHQVVGYFNYGYRLENLEYVDLHKVLKAEILDERWQGLLGAPEQKGNIGDYQLELWNSDQLEWLADYLHVCCITSAESRFVCLLTDTQKMLLTELLTKGYVDKYTWKNTGSGYYLATVKSELDEVLADAGIESFMRIDEAGLGLVKSGYSRELFLTRFFANYDGPIAMQELDGGKVRFIDMQETANIHSLMGADLPFSPRIKAGHWSDILLVDGVAVEVPSILKQVITKLWFGKGISIDVKDIDADERTIANQYQKLMDKLIALGLIVPRNYIYKARGKLVFYYPNFSLRGSKPRYSEVEA